MDGTPRALLPVRAPETLSMRAPDGVRLDADVYRPDAPGPFPVLLMRHAYGRRIASTLTYAHPSWYAARGYLVVIQDVRGRGTSEGAFRAVENEASDGAAAVRWAAALDGADGRVGMFGFSYQGVAQLMAAVGAGPALRAIAPAMLSWDARRDWAWEGGAFRLGGALAWGAQVGAETARLAGDETAYLAFRAAAAHPPTGERVAARPALMERHGAHTHYAAWRDEPETAEYWRRIAPAAQPLPEGGHPPALFVGGWYDSHLPGTLAAFEALRARGTARLLVGPWTHIPWSRRVGPVDFGPEAASPVDALQIRWFDRWLKDAPNGVEREAPIRLFDMGTRAWRDLADWPAATRRLHPRSTGRAALDTEDGALADAPAEDADHLVHDPWRPVPNAGGGRLGNPPGPWDRAPLDARPEVLTYTTDPLAAPLALAGRVRARLRVATTARGFDLHAVLGRVAPGGACTPLAEGIASRTGVAGEATVEIDLLATCCTLTPGERLRLSVAASCFPAIPVNPGTGEPPVTAPAASAEVIDLRLDLGESWLEAAVLAPG